MLDLFFAAAVHAGVARLADRPAHRGLARRQGLLPGPLHRRHDRQPRSAHSDTTSTSSPPASDRFPTPRTYTSSRHAAVRRDRGGRLDDFLHRDPVEPLGHAHTADLRGRASQGMFWIALVYVLFASVIAFWIGRPIIWLRFKTRSSTPPSVTRWCGCAMRRRRSRSTAASWPSARGCGDSSRPSSPTTSGT